MIKQSVIAAFIALSTLAGAPAAKADSYSLSFSAPDRTTVIDWRDNNGGWDNRGYDGGWDRGRGRDYVDVISPRRVQKILYRRGFSDISAIRLRGPNYIVEADGPRNGRVRVIIDARSGDIIGMRSLDWRMGNRGDSWGDRGGWGGNRW